MAHEGEKVKQGTTLLGAIWVILVADVIMSLDNVIGVAAAAEGDMRLVVFGIALSIPIVVWGSGVLARLMNRYPWIILLAGGILGEVAGKMMLHDQFIVSRFGDVARRGGVRPAHRPRDRHHAGGLARHAAGGRRWRDDGAAAR